VDAIVFAARRLAAEHVAVIIVLRDEGEGAPELAMPAIHLEGLHPAAVGAMLSDVAGRDVPGTVARALRSGALTARQPDMRGTTGFADWLRSVPR